jgi:CelD/BcsL family acetyltransferase involved in cellulose biosynthesis
MKVFVLRPEELSDADLARWSEIRGTIPELASPFFTPQYTIAVSSIRSDVRVAILEDGGRIVGFFAHQRGRSQAGRPVGGPLCDFQGLVSERDIVCDARELLRQAGLRSWRFDHLASGQTVFWPHLRRVSLSRSIDLTSGFDLYAASRRRDGTKQMRSVANLSRKLAREWGPIHFQKQDDRLVSLRQVLTWKSAQYLRSGLVDAFRYRWMVELLEVLLETREKEFAGILSTLSAGDRMVAAHMGIRSTDVWHYWITAYDPEFRRYSPGLILLTEMARAAPSLDIHRIDLGKGDELYKRRFANQAVEVAEGWVARSGDRWTDRLLGQFDKMIFDEPAKGRLSWSRRFFDRERRRIAYR